MPHFKVLSIKYSIPDKIQKNTTGLFPSLMRVLQEKIILIQ